MPGNLSGFEKGHVRGGVGERIWGQEGENGKGFVPERRQCHYCTLKALGGAVCWSGRRW